MDNKVKKGLNEAKKSVVSGGNIAKNAKEQIENETGKKVISNQNAKKIFDSFGNK